MTIQNTKNRNPIFLVVSLIVLTMMWGCSLRPSQQDEDTNVIISQQTEDTNEINNLQTENVNDEMTPAVDSGVQEKTPVISEEQKKTIAVFESNDYEAITSEMLPEVAKVNQNSTTKEESVKQESNPIVVQNSEEPIILPEQKNYHVLDDITSRNKISTSYENKPDGTTEITLIVEAPDMSHFFEWLSDEIDSYDDMATAIETYAKITNKKQTNILVSCDAKGNLSYSEEEYLDAVMGGFYSAYLEFCKSFFEMGQNAFGN